MTWRKAVLSREKLLGCLALVTMLSIIYFLNNARYVRDLIASPLITNYIIIPLFWLICACTVLNLPRSRPVSTQRFRNSLKQLAFFSGLYYLILLVICGLVEGFGQSPYSFSFPGVLINLIMVGAVLLGTEYSRAYLICSLPSKNPYLSITIISVFLTMHNLPLANFRGIKNIIEGVRLAGGTVLPLFSEQLFASYLACLGGVQTSLIYMGVLQAFRWFCPILPKLGWVSKTLLGTLIPLTSLVIIQHIYFKQSVKMRRGRRTREGALGWFITCIISVCMVWFAAGLFPVYPQVIATGSMQPMIWPGDVILAKKINAREVKLGDVIHYRLGQAYVVHRIVSVNKGEVFKTKGDNNSSEDTDPVGADQIKGKVILVVPTIGWPTLLIKGL